MKYAILLASIASALLHSVAVAATPTTPNIILVMSDDQGWGDVGFNGNKKLHTPHLDAMAAEGVRFDRFYASAPLCSPTRGSCLTGRYPFRFGVLAGDDSRVIMDRVIPFIETNKDQPFFATVWFHAPHGPVVAGESYRKRYSKHGTARQNLYGCITVMDEQIGRLRDRLDKLGLSESTAIFFCSDNGPADKLTKKGIASAGPFKGYKHTMHEGGLLVPACVVWPNVIQSGTTTNVRCSTVDFFPTIAGIVDFEFGSKDKRPIDGMDLMKVIRGEVNQRPSDLFFGYRRLHGLISLPIF